MDSGHPASPRRSIADIAFSGAVSLFFLVVGTALLLEAPVAIYRQEAAWDWQTAPGLILSVGHSFRGGTSVKYNYFVAGKIYESSSGDLPHISRARLKAGTKITV